MTPVSALRLHSPDDPDGARASAILNASVAAECARTFRRRIWRRVSVLSLVWIAMAAARLLTGPEAVTGFAFLLAVTVVVTWSEYRAARKVRSLLTAASGTERSSPPCSA